MLTSTITRKGQLTLPVRLRRELEIKPSDKVVFIKRKDKIYIEKLATIDDLFGSLSNPKVKPLSIAEMKRSVEKGMFSKNDIA
ncbi:MAG: hypothetical protein US60_C0015G0002 [Microgenomates group bacterium GW2011_GWC1_37_8]|uniref:SpoVT-AbrB domain-containing protein n=2 Tax=Candidatus Woeseibacteriota TaxID=1752722 RepID=A0A0G0NJE9_9BACT|nr:MAG: hypothetical protein US60_C0015G0002 [Microgenomates group bacterium GW2011_GWC1_37_8]KKQ86044.1 MAG: hypothetical protein UT08_C0002G0066 [Candidatus Woesebacteria bacterium GW2011_GWB1_38_8]OGM21197.1 MAG: hypothetical protein A2863_04075 [Candidatus Woesebacteria bacterium RIFCSPHIGHO2_01_FULL_38_9b]